MTIDTIIKKEKELKRVCNKYKDFAFIFIKQTADYDKEITQFVIGLKSVSLNNHDEPLPKNNLSDEQKRIEHIKQLRGKYRNILISSEEFIRDKQKELRASLIGQDQKICQGEPIIRGTRISVSHIVELHRLLQWNIPQIKDAHPHLSNEQITAALEYYGNHKREIDKYLREEREIDAPDKHP